MPQRINQMISGEHDLKKHRKPYYNWLKLLFTISYVYDIEIDAFEVSCSKSIYVLSGKVNLMLSLKMALTIKAVQTYIPAIQN